MLSKSIKSASLLATLVSFASAHSWVEEIYQIAPNGTLVGDVGYPRGWIARTSTNPNWSDSIPQWLIPPSGQAAYSGNEILNKYDFDPNPKFPMLQAAPGDHIAVIHLENGHTTLPENQPLKPRNRGTIFFYGTSEPKPKERLLDVHLAWNRNGTGGDKRGRLLGTRNYDDGQCYQPNPGPISNERASTLASIGAYHDRELRCQSDIQLPEDLKPNSVYTVYWYWDWPDLNKDHIDLNATSNGIYPWAGTFMRGEKDPHGFTMAAIAKNESYASTFDIKIGEKPAVLGNSAKVVEEGAKWNANQNVYSKAIEDQMNNNFQVDIDANKQAGTPFVSSTSSPSSVTNQPDSVAQISVVTQTRTVTVLPTTMVTVYVTDSAQNPALLLDLSATSKSPSFATATVPASSAAITTGTASQDPCINM